MMKSKMIIILLISIYSNCQGQIENNENNDEKLCNEVDYNNNDCWSVELKSKNNICCLTNEPNYNNLSEIITQCSIISYEDFNIYSNPKLKAMIREINGFNSIDSFNEELNNDIDTYFEFEALCKDGNISYNSDESKYTNEEINILKSNTHCLYYYSNSYEITSITKEKCFNANLLESTKDEGIECGYYNFEITYDGEIKKNIQTCYLLNLDNLNTKQLDNFIQNEMDSFVNIYSEYKSISYEIEIFGPDGNSFKYNKAFSNEEIIYDNHVGNNENGNIIDKEIPCEEIEPYSDNDCFSFLSNSFNKECCFNSEIINNEDPNNKCLLLSSNDFNMLSNNKYKLMMKELIFFGRNNENFIFNQEIKCKGKSTNLDININSLTNKEINILNSDNHCLYYFSQSISKGKNYKVSKERCFNADLIQSSKDAGIECGYYNFTLIYGNGKIKNYQTCYLFNPDFINYKKFDFYSKINIETLIETFIDVDKRNGEFISYKINISLSNEKSFTYNSIVDVIKENEDFIIRNNGIDKNLYNQYEYEDDLENTKYFNLNIYIILFIIILLFML